MQKAFIIFLFYHFFSANLKHFYYSSNPIFYIFLNYLYRKHRVRWFFVKAKLKNKFESFVLSRFQGVKDVVIGEGTHFMIPWVQMPIIFDIRARPKNVPTITGMIRIWFV